jgi:3-phenylpropionate/trans-cinnamate dioxygenase ferredoxin reductase component
MPARNTSKPIVIVGGGLAGGNAAATLRGVGFGGRIVLIGDEPGVPFGRPPLSKTYLRSEEGLDGWYVKPAGWYEEHDIERVTGSTVVTVDPATHSVVLDSGRTLEYQKVLIATGGRNRRLTVPGAGLDGIHHLRTVAECDAIKLQARGGRRAVVIGMGFIGCEVAASLTQLGVRVTAIFGGAAPLERVLGRDVGEVMGAIHRDNGVELLADHQVGAIEGAGRAEAVVTGDGVRVACDFVVVGIGIEPVAPAFVGASVVHSGAIDVDERCRASAPDVYAAGDMANHLHPIFGRIRVEHYNNAEKQGRAAARSMLGATDPYDYVHSFWSDQYEHKLEYVGHAAKWDQFVVRGSLADRKLVGFYVLDGQIRAAVGLDRGGDPELDKQGEMAACARLVAQRSKARPAELVDDRVDLWSLVRS